MALATSIALPDRYRVERHIASGGMASVWEVHDTRLGRLVAVKVLAQHIAADEASRKRFTREARTAARVSDCQHVVTIYDVGEHEGRAFIVMELFRGGTVADRLRAGGVPRATAVRWLREAAVALDCAHGQGIVHRDVKPANLLVDARDRLAVGDFGIARLADDTQLTQTGTVLGTAAYLSPEQALGQPATEASDRYALAVVAFELLCGRRPFLGDLPAAQARQHVEAAVPRMAHEVPGLPAATDDVLAWGMAKAPEERPPTAGRFVAALADALGPASEDEDAPTRPVAVVRPRTPEAAVPRTPLPPRDATTSARVARTPRPAPAALAERPEPTMPPEAVAHRGRRRWLAPVAALAALAVAGGGAAVALTGGDPERPASEPTAQEERPTSGGSAEEEAPSAGGGTSGSAPDDSGSGSGSGASGSTGSGQEEGSGSGAGDGGSGAGQGGADGTGQGEGDGSGQGGSGSGSSGSGSGSEEGDGGGSGQGDGAQTPAPAPEPQPAPAPSGDPVALNDQGFALNRDERYADAVPVLQASVDGFRRQGRTGEVAYAYALYNLGRALHRSGRSEEAIPVLEERLRFPNQRGTVRAELRAARRAAEEA